ncbi:MAG: hypothetical protein LBS99_00905 [Clostridiales bacterium]|nr:hypothetical protein [Clostridiales bacterium]
MGQIKCTTCGDTIDTREILTCSSCGSMMCGKCTASSGGLCSNCYSAMRYNN